MAQLGATALDTTIPEHRTPGLPTSPEQVHALIVLSGGTLLTLVTGPPEAVTRQDTLALARCLVGGVLGIVPGT